MENFPAPARPVVERMIAEAAAHPERAVAFQGAPGANSHIAARQAFPDCLPLPCFSFEDAIDAVRLGQADCAIIPIENSLHGRVADIHFLLPESGLVITGEHFLPIRYALMGTGTLEQRTHNELRTLSTLLSDQRIKGLNPLRSLFRITIRQLGSQPAEDV